MAQPRCKPEACAARNGSETSRPIARAGEAHRLRGRRSSMRRDRADARRGVAQGTREVSRPGPCARIVRTDARPYAEGWIAGGAGMRRRAANAPGATAGNAGKGGARRTDGGAAAKNSPPKAIFRLASAARARRMHRKPCAQYAARHSPQIRSTASTHDQHGKHSPLLPAC